MHLQAFHPLPLSGTRTLGFYPQLPQLHCVTRCKARLCSVPQFPHLCHWVTMLPCPCSDSRRLPGPVWSRRHRAVPSAARGSHCSSPSWTSLSPGLQGVSWLLSKQLWAEVGPLQLPALDLALRAHGQSVPTPVWPPGRIVANTPSPRQETPRPIPGETPLPYVPETWAQGIPEPHTLLSLPAEREPGH